MFVLKVVFKNSAPHFVCLEFVFSFYFLSQDVGLCIFRRIVLYFDSRCPDALGRKGVSIGH